MIIDSMYAHVELPKDKMLELRANEDIEVPPILKKLEFQLHIKIGGDEVVLNYGGGEVEPIPEGLDPIAWSEDFKHITYLRVIYSKEMKQCLKISADYSNPELNINPSSTWKFAPPLRRTLEDRF